MVHHQHPNLSQKVFSMLEARALCHYSMDSMDLTLCTDTLSQRNRLGPLINSSEEKLEFNEDPHIGVLFKRPNTLGVLKPQWYIAYTNNLSNYPDSPDIL